MTPDKGDVEPALSGISSLVPNGRFWPRPVVASDPQRTVSQNRYALWVVARCEKFVTRRRCVAVIRNQTMSTATKRRFVNP